MQITDSWDKTLRTAKPDANRNTLNLKLISHICTKSNVFTMSKVVAHEDIILTFLGVCFTVVLALLDGLKWAGLCNLSTNQESQHGWKSVNSLQITRFLGDFNIVPAQPQTSVECFWACLRLCCFTPTSLYNDQKDKHRTHASSHINAVLRSCGEMDISQLLPLWDKETRARGWGGLRADGSIGGEKNKNTGWKSGINTCSFLGGRVGDKEWLACKDHPDVSWCNGTGGHGKGRTGVANF